MVSGGNENRTFLNVGGNDEHAKKILNIARSSARGQAFGISRAHIRRYPLYFLGYSVRVACCESTRAMRD